MEKIEGIIFDVDGTLTSTNQLIFNSFNHITERYLGKKLTDEQIIALFGPTEDYILRKWFEKDYLKVREDYYNYYSDNHEEMADIYPGIKDLIIKIKSKTIPLGIFTGKGKNSTSITLRQIGIESYFDLIVTGDDVKNHKPSPEGINLFLKKFNLNSQFVLMVGDSPADIKAAQSAGVKIATVIWDSYAKDKVLELKSDFYFHSVDKLDQFITTRIK
ncbi:HAD family hydrolase [Bacteroidota bacterium]